MPSLVFSWMMIVPITDAIVRNINRNIVSFVEPKNVKNWTESDVPAKHSPFKYLIKTKVIGHIDIDLIKLQEEWFMYPCKHNYFIDLHHLHNRILSSECHG